MLLKFSRWSNRLGTRLLVTYLGAWLLTSVLIAASVAGVLHFYGDRLVHHSVIEVSRYFGAHLKFDDHGRPIQIALPQDFAWVISTLPQDFGYRVFNDRGEVLLWSSPETQQAWTSAALRAEPAEADARLVINGFDMQMRTVAVAGPQERLWLQVTISDRLIQLRHAGSTNRLVQIALATALVSVLLLGGVLFYALRKLLEPIRKISLDAREIELAQLDRRLDPKGVPGELLPLVESFNHALGRLELGYANQRRFLADTAHELKTPLALLRGQLELNGVADTALLIRDVDLITRQVQQLLMLAEVSETRNYISEPVDVERVAADVALYLGPLAQRREVALEVRVSGDGPPLNADRSALFVLLKNLAENALSFAPAGTAVTLSIDENSLRVRDRGPGIAPEHFAHLFERFWRAPERQDEGAGLGLAICLEAAHAHGWHLEARNAKPGAEFVLTFSRGS
jgi:two-component system sensor histidine kinase QseC